MARFPEAISTVIEYLKIGTISPFQLLLFVIIALGMILMVIEVNEGQRRVSIQYAKRVVGRKNVRRTFHIPAFESQSGRCYPDHFRFFHYYASGYTGAVRSYRLGAVCRQLFAWGSWPNTICYGILIFIFTYFYTAISLNIKELADNMKKYGGFIPGIRPGEPTMIYIDKVMSRITLAGALFLAFIAILPNFIGNITGIQGVYFGGTSLLIVVGVALDTMRQAQSLMVTRNYQGFIK